MTHSIKINEHYTLYVSVLWQIVVGVGFTGEEALLGSSFMLFTAWLGPFAVSLERFVPATATEL